MNGYGSSAQGGRGLFMSSLTGVANILAVILAFFGTTPLFDGTIDWVRSLSAGSYGYGFQELIAFAWFGICALLIFYIAKAVLGTIAAYFGLAFADRFL